MALKKLFMQILKMALVVFIAGIIGSLLLMIAFLLPTEKIVNNVKSSVSTLVQETNYFYITPGISGAKHDNYTEAVYLNEAMVGKEDAGLLDCVFSGYRFQADPNNKPVEDLLQVTSNIDGAGLKRIYARFFNGYLLLIKPLLLLMTYGQIREFNLYVCLILTMLMLYLMRKRNLNRFIPSVVISILFIHPLTVALTMTFVCFYYCMIIPCIIMLTMDISTLKKRSWLIFVVTGAAAFYFNMNYFQLLSFGMPISFFFLIVGIPDKPIKLLKYIGDFFVAWFAGYAGMMVFKWGAYAIIIDQSIFKQVLNWIIARTDTDRGSRLNGIMMNINIAKGNVWWNITEFAFIIYSITQLVRNKMRNAAVYIQAPELVLMLVMIAFPIIRYLIFTNHVTIHNWVTYRLLMMPVLSFNLLLTIMRYRDGLVKD